MCWMSADKENGDKILHLDEGSSWTPYYSSPHAIPDHPIPGGSKGWATYLHLKDKGWTLVREEE
ncbi:hypothetical protein K9N68_37685 (plasmid) [Kovacikia minuta CCNUW1]|nr:hypothetical protein K9N68_37685 [Kovacikia minuta CCNUW1]